METTEVTVKYQAHLQRGGTGLTEMRRLLEAFAEHGDYQRLRDQAHKENLLAKTSDDIVKDALYAFKRRFLSLSSLPSAGLVAQAMCSRMSEAAKRQVLWAYFVSTDPLLKRCYRDLVLPRLDTLGAQLSVAEVEEHLGALSSSHPELANWSGQLRQRWARGLLAVLRSFDLMERAPATQLRRLWLLPEPFAFFWLWFWQREGSFLEVEKEELWPLLQLDEAQRERLLVEGQLRGWWRYQRLGGMVQFQPRYSGLEEWLSHGLG